MIEIPLTQGQVAMVDDIDADLADLNWFAYKDKENTFYARRSFRFRVGENQRTILMHRVVLERVLGRSLRPTEKVDHIHQMTLDNRRSEIRLASNSQNLSNRGCPINNSSGYKGVTWHKAAQQWVAQIRVNNKQEHIGCFDTPEDAARAYDKAALDNFGEFAYTNFPKENYK